MSSPSLELCPGRMIGPEHPVFIIAEIGQNHQGDINIAKQMISAAARAGADCVKFQKSSLRHKFNTAALEREYSGEHSWGSTYGEHKRHLEFSEEEFRELQRHAAQEEVFFTASAMDLVSAEFLRSISVPFIKIGSGDSNNLPLLTRVSGYGVPLVVSTGMSDLGWVRTMVSTVTTDQLVLLQCTSSYPCSARDTCLGVLDTFRQEFPRTCLGYSGHETGIAISVAAAARGARVLERHVTLDKSWKGSDHKCSLDMKELATMVHLTKNNTTFIMLNEVFTKEEMEDVKEALEVSEKKVLDSEQSCIAKLGKTIVAARQISKNSVISGDDVIVKVAEPRGIDPKCVDHYLGKIAACDIEEDQSIVASMLTCLQLEITQNIDNEEEN